MHDDRTAAQSPESPPSKAPERAEWTTPQLERLNLDESVGGPNVAKKNENTVYTIA